jgi:CRISPR-associated protein Csb2
VEVAFDAPQPGPLIIGDGRYLGLGLLAPVRRAEGVLAFAIKNEFAATLEPLVVARALRRAVLARAQAEIGEAKALPLFITGHERDGAPARGGSHRHIAFVHDPGRRRLLLIAPHVFEHRSPARSEAKDWDVLERAMIGFQALRVGGHVLRVTPTGVDFDGDPLFAPAREWESMTPYRVVRHRKLADAAAAVSADIVQECREARLPSVTAQTREARGITGSGLTGRARLAFEVAVPGPILIGRDRHFGGGLFLGIREIPQG